MTITPDDTWRCTQCRKDCEPLQSEGPHVLSRCCVAVCFNTSPEPSVPHHWPATIDASDLLVQQLEAAINGQPIEDYNVLIDLKDQIQRARK